MSKFTLSKLNIFLVIIFSAIIFLLLPLNVSLAAEESRIALGKPGPIFAETVIVNGMPACKNNNDKPQKSSKNPPGHIDGECCLDPDETPNSNCYYSPAKYGGLIQKYLNKIKR